MRPKFITFTGVDKTTRLQELNQISSKYPVEFGVLFGGGGKRHNEVSISAKLEDQCPETNFSAHLCRLFVNWFLEDTKPQPWLSVFNRVQLNARDYDLKLIHAVQGTYPHKDVIIQSRGTQFPEIAKYYKIYALHDESGGRGKTISKFPVPNDTRIVGYSGGIGPDNVLDVIESITAENYWVDMETSLRDDYDRFDLDKVWEVCEKVYGETA